MSPEGRTEMVELLADRILGDEQTCADLMAYFEGQLRSGDGRVRRRIAAAARSVLWMFTATASVCGPLPAVPVLDASLGGGYPGMAGWAWSYGPPFEV